jgi:hypothetical protein
MPARGDEASCEPRCGVVVTSVEIVNCESSAAPECCDELQPLVFRN